MLRLRNIEKNKNIISATYEPEASGEIGNVSVDVVSGDIISSKKTSHDEPFAMYLSHAVHVLEKMAKSGEELPNERLVMWY